MGRQMDESLWEAWRRRLARYEQWDGTVAAFCLREGVSTVAFYQWRRKLAGDVSAERSRATRERSASDESPSFVPVRITAAERIEIELPNGVWVRRRGDATRTLDAVFVADNTGLAARDVGATRERGVERSCGSASL